MLTCSKRVGHSTFVRIPGQDLWDIGKSQMEKETYRAVNGGQAGEKSQDIKERCGLSEVVTKKDHVLCCFGDFLPWGGCWGT